MPDRTLKLRDLRRILRSFGIAEDPSRGKGSHTMFYATIEGRVRHFPIPTHGEVSRVYVRRIRVVFALTAEYGIDDADFYGR